MRSTLELIFVKEEFVILTVSEDVTFNKQKEFEDLGHEIWLKVELFIEVVTSDRKNKGELIFSKTESVMLRELELTAMMYPLASLESISLIRALFMVKVPSISSA